MIIDLSLAKKYLRIEDTYIEEDDILTIMIDNAEVYIENAVGAIDSNNPKMLNQAKLLALVLVTDFYENRELTGKVSEKVRFTINSIITQLNYCYATEESSG